MNATSRYAGSPAQEWGRTGEEVLLGAVGRRLKNYAMTAALSLDLLPLSLWMIRASQALARNITEWTQRGLGNPEAR